ncbi:MAG: hypothetical protein ACRECZ_08315 [Methylocella sp.]
MIAQLANLAFHAKLESTQVLAIKELLDRGYGKAAQPVAGDTNGAPIAVTVRWLE